jgi:hypothetical protein
MAFGPKNIGVSLPAAPALPAMPAPTGGGAVNAGGGAPSLGAHGFSIGHDAGMGAGLGAVESALKAPSVGGKSWQGGKPWGKKKI